MTKLKSLYLRTPVDSPALGVLAPYESKQRDRFTADGDIEIDDLGSCVRIKAKHGVVRVAWANVIEAWEADTQPQTGTAQAAAPTKARGAK